MAEQMKRGRKPAADEKRDGVLLAHPGVEDATQRRFDPSGEPVVSRDPRRGPAQSGPVQIVEDVAGEQYDVEQDPMRPYVEHNGTELYRKQYVLLPAVDGTYPMTDATNDIVPSALNGGSRPVGDAFQESVADHPDGLHKIVTWAVPVKSARDVERPDTGETLEENPEEADRDNAQADRGPEKE